MESTIVMTAPRSDLGRAVTRALDARPAPRRTGPGAVLHLGLQPANTLLHDGHAWRRHTPARLLAGTRRALAAHRDAGLFVHASYAFLRALEEGAPAGDRIGPIAAAARRAEAMVLASGVPACVVRLGYLYGPDLDDLRAYRAAFRIGRPYWAGPAHHLQDHLHLDDAAHALLLAARRGRPGRTYYATDGRPASFAAFMDHFARAVGNPLPLHLPGLSRRLAHIVVAEEHMQMVDLGVHGEARPAVPGFRPLHPDYRAGLAQVLEAWRAEED